jgi:hypothetical protein
MNVKPTPSAMALTRRNAQVVKRLTSKPRQLKQDQQQGENQVEQEPTMVDPEEQQLLDEIEQLQAQITASESKIALVEAGEKTELKKIEETKERRLRRVDAERQSLAKANSNFDYEEARRVDDEYKRIQQVIKNLKKDNARVHDETRKIKIEILATASNVNIIEESTLEMNQYIADVENALECHLREQEQLLKMASYYQDGIKNLQGSLERKDPEISRVKKLRFHYEDKIDEIVEVFKNKCSDADLVEELTSMAIDEAGWDGDWSEVPNERLRLNVVTKTPYTNAGEETEEDRESPKSVADLVSISSHSLHVFREEYSY